MMKFFSVVALLVAVPLSSTTSIYQGLKEYADRLLTDELLRNDRLLAPRVAVDISNIVDSLFAQIRVNMMESGKDPIRLPESFDTFNVHFYDFLLDGSFSFSNARLGGFATIHRTGECTADVKAAQNKADVVLNVGGNDIILGFDIALGAGFFKKNLQVELIVSHVDIMIDAGFKLDLSEVTLNDFRLKEIGAVKVNIGGIGGGGSAAISSRLTMLSNLAKDSLTYAFQEALRPVIELVLGLIVQNPNDEILKN